jgi:ribosome-associated protein
LEIAHTIVDALEAKKGEDIILIDIHEIAYFAEYFVICSGTSERMLQALADAAIDQVEIQYDLNGRIEGQPNDGWVLVDFGDIILHLFYPERRDYYRLEELWSRGKVVLHLQ